MGLDLEARLHLALDARLDVLDPAAQRRRFRLRQQVERRDETVAVIGLDLVLSQHSGHRVLRRSPVRNTG